MKLQRPIVVAALALLAVVAFAVIAAPLLVAGAVRTWVWYYARQEGLAVGIGAVEAPLFRPVVLHDVRLHGAASGALDVTLEIARVQFGLDFHALLAAPDARRIRDLWIDGAHVVVREMPTGQPVMRQRAGTAVTQLFADAFRVSRLDFRLESGGTIIDVRDASISASEIETGTFTVADLAIASPLISKRFTNLSGATSWQNQRLTIAAVTLARGIDIDAITADFSHVAAHRIGLEFNIDVFGGKVRANVMSDTRDNRELWDVAGTASEISLAQMAETLAWSQPAAGSIRTCKFTFRGDVSDPLQATTSVWVEVNGLIFGDRTADTVMLGGSIYNRRVHLEQLYVKQPTNQFTLSGDAPLPARGDDWTRREMNADLSANIGDLDAFARLFGARAGEYTGAITAEGVFVADAHKVRGTLSATGEIQLLDAPLPDAGGISADVSCNGGHATVRYAELRSSDANVAVWGEVAFADLRRFKATLFPTVPLTDVTSAPSGSCIRRLALAPIAKDDSTRPEVDEITVQGGLTQADWTVSLHTGRAEHTETVRAFRICPATASADQLSLAARSPAVR